MGRLFNSLPYDLQKLTGVETKTFKKELVKWLKVIPDTTREGEYAARVSAPSNSMIDQRNHWRPYK